MILEAIVKIKKRHKYLFWLVFVSILFLVFLLKTFVIQQWKYGAYLLVGIFFLAFVPIMYNLRKHILIYPSAVIFIGALCNVFALAANGMQMPVIRGLNQTLMQTKIHKEIASGAQAELPFLVDRFQTALFIFSIGDIIMLVGFFGYIGFLIYSLKKRKKIKWAEKENK